MPNMDYPGPCLSCDAIEGCSTEEARKESITQYCKGLDMELTMWKARLYDVMVKADEEKRTTGAQYSDTINHIKSTVRELEMHMKRMDAECPMDMHAEEQRITAILGDLRLKYSEAMSHLSPGYMGG